MFGQGRVVALALSLVASGFASAGVHTWDVRELFSDGSGNVQFIELWEANGGAGEVNTAGIVVSSNSNTFVIPSNVAAPTTNKSILLATAGFAALAGAPTPDHIIPANFFSTGGDSVKFGPYDTTTFAAGQLPTDGINSFVKGGTTGPATPENYAGQTWSPPGVPDGAGGQPVLVGKILPNFPNGDRLTIYYDATTCLPTNTDHLIVYGFGSQLPASPGGSFGLSGARCNIGLTTPTTWSGVPDPISDPSRLLFLLVLAENNSGTEGSWGTDSAGAQRVGPMVTGASGQCTNFQRDVSNSCGQ